jgi:integrase
MPRPTNRLTARAVVTAGPGYHADGAGLYLLVTKEGTASWVFRFRRHGRLREMGLGSAAVFTLAEARERAREARKLLADGLDPIEHRRAIRGRVQRLWGDAVDDFISSHRSGWKGDAQAEQWANSLTTHGPDRSLPVSAVDTHAVLASLRKIWTTKTETASRVRGRIERVWDAERVRGTVSGENPARWKGHLSALLPKPSKVRKPKHHRAMPYADVPAFMARLRERDNPTRRALRFTILTAARTEEVLGAEWAEFDLKRSLWNIPEGRMKGGRPHTVPLPAEAVAILKALPRAKAPFRLSENAMLYLVQRAPPKGLGLPYTVHGFRSAFKDWAAEETDTPNEVSEMALAHRVKTETEAAYRRGALLEKRRALMDAWAAYLS